MGSEDQAFACHHLGPGMPGANTGTLPPSRRPRKDTQEHAQPAPAVLLYLVGGQVHARLVGEVDGRPRGAAGGPAPDEHVPVGEGVRGRRPGGGPDHDFSQHILLRLLFYRTREPSRASRRSRWGMTVYLGSRAEWKPAL